MGMCDACRVFVRRFFCTNSKLQTYRCHKDFLMRIRALIFLLLLVASAATAFTHHSFAAYYDMQRPVSVTGTIVEVDWVDPAVFVHLKAEDKATGKITTWAFEAESHKYLEKAFGL